MNLQNQKPPFLWNLIMFYVLILISAVVIGLLYYNNQKKTILLGKQIELSAYSDLKIRQIIQWRLERISDGQFYKSNVLMVGKLIDFINDPSDDILKSDARETMKSMTDNFDYRSIILIDTSGNVMLSYPFGGSLPGSYVMQIISKIKKDREVVLTDLHIINSEDSGFIHLDLVVPLLEDQNNDTIAMGFMVVKVDPESVLYPLIESWPTNSESAETYLIKKEDNEIVYLNHMRHKKNYDLSFRMPVETDLLPEAMALNGMIGTVNGIDYRNVPVVASMKKVPGTNWFMIAKIDRSEVFQLLGNKMRMAFVVEALFLLATGLFFVVLWRNHKISFYKDKYETELNRLALVTHFDYILKFANDIILLIDRNLVIMEANDRALESYKYKRDEFIGRKLASIRAPEAVHEISEQIQSVEDSGSATFETMHLRSDGSVFPVEISARLVNIEGVKYYQTIARDITDRKFAENTLRDSEERFRKIFEDSPFPMIMTGKDLGIIRANCSFCKMIGRTEEELKMKTFWDLINQDDLSEDQIALMRLITREIPVYQVEKRYQCKESSVILGATTLSIIRNNDDEVQFYLVMVEDITARRRAEYELLEAKEKAEESDRLKTAFLHNISHEIRTPMNAIVGFSSLLSEPGSSESERNQFIEIISQSSHQLLSIINDIVDIANIESGQVNVNMQNINLNHSMRMVYEQFSYRELEKNVAINLSNGLKDEDAMLVTDETKLVQILSNLIGNSLKFTKEGSVDFGYNVTDGFVEFYVKDTGIGIPSDHVDKIFNRFYQVDGTDSRQYGGTGLGLSICKAYVDLFGGNIKVESEQGEGSVFTFTIPYVTN